MMNIELNSGTIPVLKVLGLNPNGVTTHRLAHFRARLFCLCGPSQSLF